MTRPGIEPRSPGPLYISLVYIAIYIYIYIYIYIEREREREREKERDVVCCMYKLRVLNIGDRPHVLGGINACTRK